MKTVKRCINVICLSLMLYSCGDTNTTHKYHSLAAIPPDSLSYEQLYNRTLSLWDVDFEEIDIKTHKGSAHVIIAGPKEAPPLVLFHGMNSSSTVWYPNIEALAKKNRVYAIDFILETNKSKLDGEFNQVNEVVDWYEEVFDSLHLTSFSLAGASMGGWWAVNVALNSPSSINKLILISPAQTFILIPPGEKMLKNMLYSNDRNELREVLLTTTYDVDNINQLYIDQYYRGLTIENGGNMMMKMMPFKANELKKLTMPILLVIGDDDFINNKRSLNKAEEAFSDVETHTLHARHFITMDQTKKINKLMVRFLEKK